MQNNITFIEMTREAGHVARMGDRRSAYRVFSLGGSLRERENLENLAQDWRI
jgi:hypothetical protein